MNDARAPAFAAAACLHLKEAYRDEKCDAAIAEHCRCAEDYLRRALTALHDQPPQGGVARRH